MTSKHKDLQPWFDYFDMLNRYKQNGFLEVLPGKHEAYITPAALLTLSPTVSMREKDGSNSAGIVNTYWGKDIANVARYIRAYAAYLSRDSGMGYYNSPFALHVVKEDMPHDLFCTLLVIRRRRWFSLWRKVDTIVSIFYSTPLHGTNLSR